MATMLLNLAWATGETIGAPAAAGLSQATSDAVPLLLLAAIMVATLGPVLRARLTVAGAGPARVRSKVEQSGPERARTSPSAPGRAGTAVGRISPR